MQEFWRILDFNWGDASQYPDVTLDTPNGSSESLGTAGASSAALAPKEPEPEGSVGDEMSSLAMDLANAFKDVDVKSSKDSSVSDSVPYYPEWNGSQYDEELPDTQLDSPQPSPVKNESKHVPPEPKLEEPQPPSSGSGDDGLKQAKKDLLLAQLRLARWADKNTFKVCSPKQVLHVLSTKHVIERFFNKHRF